MSGQDASGSAASSSTGAVPKQSRKVRKNKNKNFPKLGKKPRVVETHVETDKAYGDKPNLLEIIEVVPEEEILDIEYLTLSEYENRTLKETKKMVEAEKISKETEVTEDQTLEETKEIEEQKAQASANNEEVQNTQADTDSVDLKTTTVEEKFAPNSAKIYKTKSRKKRNRKNKKKAQQEKEKLPCVPVVVTPAGSGITRAHASVPIFPTLSYSEVVTPLHERKPDSPITVAPDDDMSLTYLTSDDYDSVDPIDDYDYSDPDYGGVQDSYYEF